MTRLVAAEFTTTGIVLLPPFTLRPAVILTGITLLIVAEILRLGAVMKSDLETALQPPADSSMPSPNASSPFAGTRSPPTT